MRLIQSSGGVFEVDVDGRRVFSKKAADTANANAVSAAARVMVARQTLEAARAQLALANARLENVDLQLSRTEVKAPVAGEIVERNARIGGIATAAGQAMFVIVRDGSLELRADIAESDLLRLKIGQKAMLRAVGGTEPLTGTIRLVEPSIDTLTRDRCVEHDRQIKWFPPGLLQLGREQPEANPKVLPGRGEHGMARFNSPLNLPRCRYLR